MRRFWEDPTFLEIAPYIRLTPAADTANGRNRIELAGNTPWLVTRKALDFKADCVRCGAPISVFRSRKQSRHSVPGSGIYVASTCPLPVNVACARGPEARTAYECIAAVVTAVQQPPAGEQGDLL